jgi:SAM-dependent methyltransferase
MITATATDSMVQASFRDPAGVVYRVSGRVLRVVCASHVQELEDFLATRTAKEATASGRMVHSDRISAVEYRDLGEEHLFEHERIPFPSFPYEWPVEMLHAAALLTLDLAQAALEEGFGLKDATPYNVLFRGPRPVFVDVLSFERRDPLDPTWMAYGQFVRTFLLPLMAARHFGLPLDRILLAQRDGLEPETVYRWAGLWRRLTPPFLNLVTIPKWLGGLSHGAAPVYRSQPASSAEHSRFVLAGLLRSCGRQLESLAPGTRQESNWSGYLAHKSLYSPAQLAQKDKFVKEALDLARPGRVLDVGANEGRFSIAAARQGAEVVAIDSDPVVAGSIWRKASAERLNVLPLVLDLTRPTPAVGWRNQECPAFLERARGEFDLVMMLAVVHHMLVTERIPLEDLLDLADELTKDYLLIEFVAPADPMFQRIIHGRDELYAHFSPAWFEAAAASRFDLVRSARIEGLHRWLYLYRRRRATN